MKSNVRDCFRFGKTRNDKASIQYLIEEGIQSYIKENSLYVGNRTVDLLYQLTSVNQDIQSLFGRKLG